MSFSRRDVGAARNGKCSSVTQSLKKLTLIRNMSQKGKTLRLHGWIYRIETGKKDIFVDGETGREASLMRRFKKTSRKVTSTKSK
jgi:carbonic anhydrase